jgi:SAM-dependent methyltransferase
MEARQTFDKVADLYAKVRQGYPAALFGDLGAMGALSPSMRVLEVGCGAGQATVDLADKVRELVALDPGAQLIEAARQRVEHAANVAFVVANFEDYPAEPAAFDLIASAQAWHWIPPQVAYPKAADALAPGGWLAVFGHVPMPPPEPFAAAFKAVVEARFPGAWGQPPPQAAYLPTGPFAGQFDASGRFGPAQHRAYDWSWTADAETFGQYLRTDSSYHGIPEAQRFELFDALAAAVDANGGEIPLPWQTHLYAARRL